MQERLAERITHSDGAANSGSFRASTAIRVARCYNSTLRLTAIPRTAPRFSSCTSRRSSVWQNSLSSPPTCAKDTSPRYSSRRPRRQKNSTKATAAKGNRMAITAASEWSAVIILRSELQVRRGDVRGHRSAQIGRECPQAANICAETSRDQSVLSLPPAPRSGAGTAASPQHRLHRSPRVLTLEESRATNHARTISKLDPALQTLFISSPRCCICHWRGPQPPRPVLSL